MLKPLTARVIVVDAGESHVYVVRADELMYPVNKLDVTLLHEYCGALDELDTYILYCLENELSPELVIVVEEVL